MKLRARLWAVCFPLFGISVRGLKEKPEEGDSPLTMIPRPGWGGEESRHKSYDSVNVPRHKLQRFSGELVQEAVIKLDIYHLQ